MKIGVFDSGVGGLTVLKELLQYKNEYYYFGDNINIPYGTKTKYELQILDSKIVELLETYLKNNFITRKEISHESLYNN